MTSDWPVTLAHRQCERVQHCCDPSHKREEVRNAPRWAARERPRPSLDVEQGGPGSTVSTSTGVTDSGATSRTTTGHMAERPPATTSLGFQEMRGYRQQPGHLQWRGEGNHDR